MEVDLAYTTVCHPTMTYCIACSPLSLHAIQELLCVCLFMILHCVACIFTHFIVCSCVLVALDVQGLYRLSGSKTRMERICQLFEAVAGRVDFSEQNPHLVANVLKHYLKRLPEPLMTFGLYQDFMDITRVSYGIVCRCSVFPLTLHTCKYVLASRFGRGGRWQCRKSNKEGNGTAPNFALSLCHYFHCCLCMYFLLGLSCFCAYSQ